MSPKFPREEFNGRLERLHAMMQEHGLTVCLLFSPENICYLTGHETPGYYSYQCLVVPKDHEPTLLVREAELSNATEYTYLRQLVGYGDSEDPIEATVTIVKREFGSGFTMGIEERSWFCPPATYQRLIERISPVAVRPIDQSVANLRLVKSSLEIQALRESARIANTAMAAAVARCEPGLREQDVAAEALAALVREGSEYLGMEPFVASGPRTGAMHASWTSRRMLKGEPVLIELAASYKRYHAALMHTISLGNLSDQLRNVSETCRVALARTLGVVRPGVTAAECHRVCCEVIREAGMLDYYRKRTGYSIGLAFAPDWGEGHILSLANGQEVPLVPGMVLHIVPAIRIPGVGGAGYSATVLVTEDGHEVLTKYEE
jgi:Xaa-Pro dipeptidase